MLEFLKSDKPNLPNRFTIALGDLIRKARLEANFSQVELAQKAYINQAAISQIETGKRSVSAEEIVYLSNALNKSIHYFFSMDFLNQINETELTILEQELLLNSRNLSEIDLRKVIAQIKAIANI
jgi:transcriptional regulator with XRE-family HTH domain